MAIAPLPELINGRARLMSLPVARYHEMIAAGLLPEGEPYELLDGVLVRKDRSAAGNDPMTVGLFHAWAVKNLAEFSRRLRRLGCHLQTQQPITLPLYDEPEPDGAIVKGTPDDYREQHPGPDDILCVIEVSDASLRQDRTTKQRIYADSGIPCYVIINLAERVIEVYTQPLRGKGRYGQSVTLAPKDRLHLPAPRGKTMAVPVRKLLP